MYRCIPMSRPRSWPPSTIRKKYNAGRCKAYFPARSTLGRWRSKGIRGDCGVGNGAQTQTISPFSRGSVRRERRTRPPAPRLNQIIWKKHPLDGRKRVENLLHDLLLDPHYILQQLLQGRENVVE